MRFKLKSNIFIPALGLGTYSLKGENLRFILRSSIHSGYRLIDTATGYNNHKDIGNTISKFNRNDLFVCTKFNQNDLNRCSIKLMCEKILAELKTFYIDAILLHTPDIKDQIKCLEQLIDAKSVGIIRCIGVSNFNIDQLEKIYDLLSQIDINQIEFHPYFNCIELKKYCDQFDIHIMAHSPFSKGLFLKNATLVSIAQSNKKTVHQIILRWG
jgi:diketogulonate reductase-like aldo/keto reductase